jgi:hypothetical protein
VNKVAYFVSLSVSDAVNQRCFLHEAAVHFAQDRGVTYQRAWEVLFAVFNCHTVPAGPNYLCHSLCTLCSESAHQSINQSINQSVSEVQRPFHFKEVASNTSDEQKIEAVISASGWLSFKASRRSETSCIHDEQACVVILHLHACLELFSSFFVFILFYED